MKTKHTPGPWATIEQRRGSIQVQVKASTVAVISPTTLAEYQSNARLIATSPELLAFALYVLKSGACQGIPGLEGYAHQVIAKATGGPVEPTKARAQFVRGLL